MLGLAIGCAADPVDADEASGQTESPPESSKSIDGVEMEELHQFAEAVVLLYEMDQSRDIKSDLGEAQTAEERQALQQQLYTEMERNIEKAGLTVPQYMVIRDRVEASGELQRRLARILEEMGAEGVVVELPR